MHPNGVWLSFLRKWADEARERGAKSASAYLKAYRSLESHAHPFTHPCETVKLAGIGDSIATKLEAAYAKWCEQNAVDMPLRRECMAPRDLR